MTRSRDRSGSPGMLTIPNVLKPDIIRSQKINASDISFNDI